MIGRITAFWLIAALLAGAMPAAAKSPSTDGIWAVTFYLEPLRALGATQCVVFTTVPGLVGGAALSGTWTSPSSPGWEGEWIQVGDRLRWYGTVGQVATFETGDIEYRNSIGGDAFNHFDTSTGRSTSAGTWSGRRLAACPAAAVRGRGGDPAQ